MADYYLISDDTVLEKNVKFHCFVNLYGCTVGRNTKIGAFVEIQKNAVIGVNCKISSHTFICEGVTIEDDVFIGHGVIFINDPYPRSINSNGELQTEDDWKVVPTLVESGVSIGSGATIMCGVTIGTGAMIGAGSLVNQSIPQHEIWAGNPARLIRRIEK